MRRSYVAEPICTIYIGGGTPSQLSGDDLRLLFSELGSALEVTIECNPDDLTPQLCELLADLPVNRVSMGAQTFDDCRLQFLRRRHKSAQIGLAVERLRRVGIGNISVDLMYGFPGETLEDWQRDIDAALELDVEHLSAYALMYEEGTPLHRMLLDGKVSEVDEEMSLAMYSELIERLSAAGYEHYEISNFARRGYRSVHNSNYWNHTPYVGLGAAAHSFDGASRQWNVDNVEAYITGVEQGQMLIEREALDDATRYNDIVMTALRRAEGLQLGVLSDVFRDYCLNMAKHYIADGLLIYDEDSLRLSRKGIFISDMIMADLMWV